MRRALNHGSLGQHLGLRQIVGKLPVEIVIRHAEQHFLLARGIGGAIDKVLAAEVHVRQQRNQRRVGLQRELCVHLVIRIARRDHKVHGSRGDTQHALGWLLLGEDQADARLVGARRPIGRIVHLEHDVAARLDHLGLTRQHDLGCDARSVSGERIAEGRASPAASALRNERNALGSILQPRITRLPDEGNNMMDQRVVAGPRFGHLDVLVFCKTGRDHHVLVIDGARSRDLECGGHLEDHVGLPNPPALDERGVGASLGLPSLAPPSAQATSVSMSLCDRVRSFPNLP